MLSPDRARVREWFALACRILGMWQLVVAASYVMTAFDMSSGLFKPPTLAGYTFGGTMVHVFGHFLLAAWLLKMGPSIALFFYPEPPEERTRGDKSSDSATPDI